MSDFDEQMRVGLEAGEGLARRVYDMAGRVHEGYTGNTDIYTNDPRDLFKFGQALKENADALPERARSITYGIFNAIGGVEERVGATEAMSLAEIDPEHEELFNLGTIIGHRMQELPDMWNAFKDGVRAGSAGLPVDPVSSPMVQRFSDAGQGAGGLLGQAFEYLSDDRTTPQVRPGPLTGGSF